MNLRHFAPRLYPALVVLVIQGLLLAWALHVEGGDPLALARLGTRFSQGDPQGTEASPAASESSRGGAPVLAATSPLSRRTVTGDKLDPTGRTALPLESRPLPQVGVNASAADEALRLRAFARAPHA